MLRLFMMVLTLFFLSNPTFAKEHFSDRPDVSAFIKQMVKKHHFKSAELHRLFDQVALRPKVMQYISRPNEERPWYAYQKLFVTEWRIRKGVEFWDRYADDLARAEKTYGVPASIIVATIGVETKYGQNTGDFRVIDALSNIAFSGSSRAKFFKSELEQFLLLTREKHLNPLKVMGSYAGAIGQPQFMPSSYRRFAVNFSNSNGIDLSNDQVDVIGSIANYYHLHGWKTGEPIAFYAKVMGRPYELADIVNTRRTFTNAELSRYGIFTMPPIPSDDSVKILQLQDFWRKEYWAVFHNFDVIKRYNPSVNYAMAVFQLSQSIVEVREKRNHG